MIEVLTLFLGLFSGVKTIELTVEEPVARVEIWFDGKAVGKISKPPWRFNIDLGKELRPHELVLIARDSELVELERTRHWINLDFEPPPNPRTELTAIAVLPEDGARLPTAQQMQGWFIVGGQAVEVVRVDPVDEDEANVLVVRDPGIQPFLDRLANFFFQFNLNPEHYWDDVPLADKEAFVVAATKKLGISSARAATEAWVRWNDHLGLGAGTNIRIIAPRAAPVSRISSRKQVFNVMSSVPSGGESLLWQTTRIRPLDFQRRTSDAVAIAGLEAFASDRRRAVLLLLEEEQATKSRYSPATVEDYLQRIRVPLFVWIFRVADDPSLDIGTGSVEVDGSSITGWRNARMITYPKKLSADRRLGYLLQVETATRELRENLSRQRIVWLRGAHLPDRIELSDTAVGITLAGTPQ